MATPDPLIVPSSANAFSKVVANKIDSERELIYRWLRCLAIVNFDLIIGKTCELCMPENSLTKDETTNMARFSVLHFLSYFPTVCLSACLSVCVI